MSTFSLRPILATCAVIASDLMAFVLAGCVGVFVAVRLGNATLLGDESFFEFGRRERLADLVLAGVAWIFWFQIVKNRYRKPIPFWSEVIEIIRVSSVMAIMNLAIIALARNDYSRSIWLIGWMALVFYVPLLRVLTRGVLLKLGWNVRPTWIIGLDENAREAQLALQSERQMGFSVQGFIDPQALNRGASREVIQGILMNDGGYNGLPSEAVFVIAMNDAETQECSSLVLDLTLSGVQNIYVIPPIRGIPLYGSDLTYFSSHEVLLLGIRNNLSMRFSKILKLIFDFVVATLLVIPVSFILMVAGLLIWFEDRGPIFYVQQRLGAEGHEFNMFKLRSMRRDAEDQLMDWKRRDSQEWRTFKANNFKMENDPRVLKVGRLMRKTSIDELPQLFNVLRGEMSLVGPRPILAREAQDYGKNLVLYTSTRPGMTGLWQISGRSKTSFRSAERWMPGISEIGLWGTTFSSF